VRWLTRGDRSEHELQQRLAGRGLDGAEIEATLQRLVRAGYIDDGRVAVNAANIAARRGQGSHRARADLEARGVARLHIEAAIAAAFADEPALARRVVSQRYGTWPKSDRERARAAALLGRRGFPDEIIADLLGE